MNRTDFPQLDYNSIRDNPETLLSLVDKYVKVQLIKTTSFIGFVHSIDPISHSIILSVPVEQNFQTVIIPGHAITDVMETAPTVDIKPPLRKDILQTTADGDILSKKMKMMSWFKWNLLPVSESGENIVIGNANIIAPYNATDICTDNPVVAMQIKTIMEKMPEEFEAK